MKKSLFALALLMMAAAPLQAQSFLDMIRQRAEEAASNAMTQRAMDEIPDEARGYVDMAADPDGLQAVTGEQALPPRRVSSVGWDGAVKPSSAKFPIPLMNEYPAVPSAEDLVNPVEAKQIAYYKAIKAVTLRAEALNADTTCEDQETLQWRGKTNDALKEAFGLTDEEVAMLDRDDLSEEEQQRLSDKMARALLGDIDTDQLEKDLGQYEGKSEDEIVAGAQGESQKVVFEVYDRNAKDLLKYTGIPAKEYKDAYALSLKDEKAGEKANKDIAKRAEAFQKSKGAAFQKEAEAFQKQLSGELTKAMFSGTAWGRSASTMISAGDNARKKMTPLLQMQGQLKKYYADVLACYPKPSAGADYTFAASERKKLLDLKNKIYATDDPSTYNSLFRQAGERIRSYRERAARNWVADVQKRFDAYKEALPKLIKVNRQAVADGIIPECALWRAPLNMVIDAGDLLAEAYSDFPSEYPKMYQEEVVREVTLPDGYIPWWPEFTVYGADDYDELMAGKSIFAMDRDGTVYQFNKGRWDRMSGAQLESFQNKKKTSAPANTSWTSSDGERTVYFNADGAFLQLPEGDQIFPYAWKKDGHNLSWVNINMEEKDGKTKYQIVKCLYKL